MKYGRGPSKRVRIRGTLLGKVDMAVRTLKDELGQPLFSDRRAFLDVAVKEFLSKQKTI